MRTTLTDTGTNEDSDFTVKDVFCRGTVGAIKADGGEGTGAGARFYLDEVTTSSTVGLFFLRALHRCLSHGSDDLWANTETFTKSPRPVTDLANVNGNIRIFRSRCDGKLP